MQAITAYRGVRVSLLGCLIGPMLMLSAGLALAGESEPLEQIVVVASKTPRPINTVAANVSVVTQAQIKATLATSLDDVFHNVPGVDAENSGVRFGTESLNIRGIGGNRVAMMLDGVPMSDQFDIGSFANATRDFVNAGFIKRTEVLHGPASSLYGSDAIGGVVAMYTPLPFDYLHDQSWGGELLATYRAADESRHVQATVAAGNSELGFLAAVSHRQGEQMEPYELPENPDFRDFTRQSLLLKLVADDVVGHSWRLNLVGQQSETKTDLQSVLGQGRFRSTTSLRGEDETRLDLVSFEYDWHEAFSWFDAGVIRFYQQHSEVEQATTDERFAAPNPQRIKRDFSFKQRVSGAEWNAQKTWLVGDVEHRFSIGLEARLKSTKEYRDATSTALNTGLVSSSVLGETFPLRDFPLSDTTQTGAFLEYGVSSQHWTGIAGVRADRYKLGAKPDSLYLANDPATEIVALSESDLSPKVGVIYHPSDSLDIYVQYAHGFRAPPFEDANIGLDIPLFNIRAIANPDLRSEQSKGIDLGLRWRSANSRLHLGVFNTDYQDFIETKVRLGFDPVSGRILFQSQNLSDANIRGLEADWEVQLPANFSIDGSVYLVESDNKESGQALHSVGPGQVMLGASWSASDGQRAFRLRTTTTRDWRQQDASQNALFATKSNTIVDLFYREKLNQALDLRVGVYNLSNTKYWRWSEVRGLSEDDPMLAMLTRPGRHVSLSLEMHW